MIVAPAAGIKTRFDPLRGFPPAGDCGSIIDFHGRSGTFSNDGFFGRRGA